MSMHASEMGPLATWLGERLRGGSLQALRMPEPATVVLSVRRPGETIHLLLSWRPGQARIHTVDRPPTNPKTPPALQGLLRKELRGAIAGLELLGDDRVLLLSVDRGSERWALAVEATGRRGAALLLGPDGTTRGATTAGPQGGRELRAGQVWAPPPPRPGPAVDRFPGPPEVRDRAVRDFFAQRIAAEHDEALTRRVLKALRGRRKRLRRRAGRQRDEADRAAEAGALRRDAELLRASFSRMRRGMDGVEVEDYYLGRARLIALNPAISPSEQVDGRYRRARKLERSGVEAGRRLRITEGELEEVETLLQLAAEDPAAALELSPKDLRAQLSRPPPGRRAAPEPRLPYRSFWWRDVELRVGRGARDNDQLVSRHARGRDLWLHVRDRPGAHVVVRFRDAAPPLELLLAAAQLALKHSGVQDGDRAEVIWTRVKELRKPKGMAPGQVLVRGERVLLVEADPALQEALAAEPPALSSGGPER